ncbi:MAG TPA: hypothetical protein VNB30_15880 [Rhizomicrobium sp.]|jgi:hypothetical protein|nr:hypothetical protein [Rhizomicrobium sp.]
MRTAKERLSHLLELAAKGTAERAALAGEVADLLHDWPSAYPAQMRAGFEALLEKIAREVDEPARRALARRFEQSGDAPLSLLNELFLASSATMQDDILRRNDAHAAGVLATIDGAMLVSAARKRGDFPAALARAARLSRAMAGEIMRDASGRALAVVAKGGGLERPLHSAICILMLPAPNIFAALTMFDRVPQNGAAHLLSAWRIRLDASLAA